MKNSNASGTSGAFCNGCCGSILRLDGVTFALDVTESALALVPKGVLTPNPRSDLAKAEEARRSQEIRVYHYGHHATAKSMAAEAKGKMAVGDAPHLVSGSKVAEDLLKICATTVAARLAHSPLAIVALGGWTRAFQ